MNEQEKEINLKRLIYKALRNWRVAAVAGIVGALAVGGTKCAMEMTKIFDPGVIEERQTEYLGELALYQQKGELIRKDIDKAETSIAQQEEYNEKSILMKIDPYNEWRGSIDFYVETDYKIIPELSYQNQNIASQIVYVYNTYITNGELYQYIINRLENKTEIRYLREVLGASIDAQNFLIHFNVRNVSEEAARELLTLVEEGMRAKQAEILQSIGEYELLTTNSSAYSQINYELEQEQKDNLQEVEDLKISLTTKQFEQLEWKRGEKNIKEPIISKLDAVKEGIKMAILTGVVIGFLIVLFYGVRYLFSKLVQDREEFDSWGCFVAELPRSYKKRMFRWVDRIISRWFLGNVKADEYEVRLASATKQIGETAKLSYTSAEPVLVLAGDLPKEELEALAAAMQKFKAVSGVRFVAAGNPLLEVSAIDTILQADGIVLAAKQEYTRKESVYQIREQLHELKKPLAAVVLTGADALM